MNTCKRCKKEICTVSTYCKSCYAILFNVNSKEYLDKKIISLYQEFKLSPTEIISRLPISKTKFYSVIKKYKIPLVNKRKKYSDKYKKKASIRMKKWLKENPQHHIKNFVGILKNEKHPSWKGDKVGYHALHKWIKRNKPKPELCEKCKQSKPYDLANISGKYKRDITDFEWLCRSCHMKSDGRMNNLKNQVAN